MLYFVLSVLIDLFVCLLEFVTCFFSYITCSRKTIQFYLWNRRGEIRTLWNDVPRSYMMDGTPLSASERCSCAGRFDVLLFHLLGSPGSVYKQRASNFFILKKTACCCCTRTLLDWIVFYVSRPSLFLFLFLFLFRFFPDCIIKHV